MTSTSGSAASSAQEPWERAKPCRSAKAAAAAPVREPTAASSAPGTSGRSVANVRAMPPVPRIPQRTFFSVMISPYSQHQVGAFSPHPGDGRGGGMGQDRRVSYSIPLPAAMLQRARDFAGTPVPARPAATVVLLRPAEEAFEVYVLRRATTMVFGGVYAFPGGGVDREDRPQTIKQDWPERLGVPEAEAQAIVGAAAR